MSYFSYEKALAKTHETFVAKLSNYKHFKQLELKDHLKIAHEVANAIVHFANFPEIKRFCFIYYGHSD